MLGRVKVKQPMVLRSCNYSKSNVCESVVSDRGWRVRVGAVARAGPVMVVVVVAGPVAGVVAGVVAVVVAGAGAEAVAVVVAGVGLLLGLGCVWI